MRAMKHQGLERPGRAVMRHVGPATWRFGLHRAGLREAGSHQVWGTHAF